MREHFRAKESRSRNDTTAGNFRQIVVPDLDEDFLDRVAVYKPSDAESRVEGHHRQLFRAANAGLVHDLEQTKASNQKAIQRLSAERAELVPQLKLLRRPTPVYLRQRKWHPLDAIKAAACLIGGACLLYTSFRIAFRILDDSGFFPGRNEAAAVTTLLVLVAPLLECLHSRLSSPHQRETLLRVLIVIAIACALGASVSSVLSFGGLQDLATAALGGPDSGSGRQYLFLLLAVGEPAAAAAFFITAEGLVRDHSLYETLQPTEPDVVPRQITEAGCRIGELERSNITIDGRLRQLAEAEGAFATQAVTSYVARVHKRNLRVKAAIEAAIAAVDADDNDDAPSFEGDGPHPPPTRGPFDNGRDNGWNLNGKKEQP